MSSVVNVSDNRYGVARLIVAPTLAEGANFTTIAAALTAASSGQTIFIRPGTYSENLTLKAGVDLCSFGGEGDSGNVTIVGTCTATFAGTCSITGIRLQTNAAPFLTVSGSSATIIRLRDCYFNCADNVGISWTTSSSSANLFAYNCSGTNGSATACLWTATGDGVLRFENVEHFYGTAVTTAANTALAQVLCKFCTFNFPLSTSGTGTLGLDYVNVQCFNQNTTAVTTAGTGLNGFNQCIFSGGTASALSLGSGTTTTVFNCNIASTNTNAVTGAGTIIYSDMCFAQSGGSILNNVTTQNYQYTDLGRSVARGQPAFSAYLGTGDANVTGDGTNYVLGTTGNALTEIYDVGSNFNTNGTFTAPVTGKYMFTSSILWQAVVATMDASISLVSSNRSYIWGNYADAASTGNFPMGQTTQVDMDAGDTITVQGSLSGGAKVVDVYGAGATDYRTYFEGHLIC